MAYYFNQPDTKADIEFKLKTITESLKALEICLTNMKKDLLKNHLNYDAVMIQDKQTRMAETLTQINHKKRSIIKYTEKLKTFKNENNDTPKRYPF